MRREVIADRRAGVAVVVACTAALLVLCAGLAVDATRSWMVRAKLQQAVDAAALMAAMQMDASNQDPQQRARWEDGVKRLFWVNFSREPYGSRTGYMGATSDGATLTPGTKLIPADPTRVNVSAAAMLPLTLWRAATAVVANARVSPVTASSGATAQQAAAFEIALALDISGSMLEDAGGGTSRVQAVKNAVADMLDIIYGPTDAVNNLSISVVPFRSSVNIGTRNRAWVDDAAYNAADWTQQAWRGCVEARQDGYDLTEHNPDKASGKPFKPLFWASTYQVQPDGGQSCVNGVCSPTYYKGHNDWRPGYVTDTGNGGAMPAWSSLPVGPNLGCSNEAVLPLTESRSAVAAKVAGLTAANYDGTIIGQGLQWSWFTLSPLWQSQWGLTAAPSGGARPLAYETGNIRKVIVLLSDGNNTWIGNEFLNPNYACQNYRVWPDCVRTDGYYNSYGQLSANRLGITMPGGVPPESSARASLAMMAALDVRTLRMCGAIKAKGVKIYTIAFKADAGSAAETLLKGCATDPSYYYNATDGAGINKAFTTIGRQLRSLRLTQ